MASIRTWHYEAVARRVLTQWPAGSECSRPVPQGVCNWAGRLYPKMVWGGWHWHRPVTFPTLPAAMGVMHCSRVRSGQWSPCIHRLCTQRVTCSGICGACGHCQQITLCWRVGGSQTSLDIQILDNCLVMSTATPHGPLISHNTTMPYLQSVMFECRWRLAVGCMPPAVRTQCLIHCLIMTLCASVIHCLTKILGKFRNFRIRRLRKKCLHELSIWPIGLHFSRVRTDTKIAGLEIFKFHPLKNLLPV